jgi:hypothetical protein
MQKVHPKRQFLEDMGALNLHHDRVRSDLFERYRFFDPLDKVQVKYEMLRAHAMERRSVVTVAAEFGFSRETYYTVLAAFQARGVRMADGKPGRPGPLADGGCRGVGLDSPSASADLSGREIAERLAAELGLSPSSDHRAAAWWSRKKKRLK